MITFYYASASPYSWRVWFALEHKALAYTLETLSFVDLKKPAYVAVNPRGRVPSIVDDGFALRESNAIVEYLEQAYPDSGRPLFPRGAREAATVRRMICEIDGDYGGANHKLVGQILLRKEEDRDAAVIANARGTLVTELAGWERALEGREFLAGEIGAADYALYPLLALTLRMEKRHPALDLAREIGPAVDAWRKRIEALPVFEKTYPPHWR